MSQTITVTSISSATQAASAAASSSHHVQWSPDTVDNEHMGKRKSKKCCVFKKRRDFGESSSSSDSDNEHAHNHHDECPHVQK